MSIRFSNSLIAAIFCFVAAPFLEAAPVAVDDSYNLNEDTVFTAGLPLVSASFNGGNSGEFVYADDTFGTNAPNNSSGSVNATRGEGGTGCLLVETGRRPPQPRTSSGAWSRTFNLTAPATVDVSLSYRLQATNTEWTFFLSRYAEAVFTMGGTRYGSGTGTSLTRLVVPNAGGNQDSGWQTANFSIPLAAGEHRMLLGAYCNSTANNHFAEALFDNVTVRIGTGNGVLNNDTGGTGTVTATRMTNPSNGVLALNNNGSFNYTPGENFFGTDSFTYRSSDSTGNSNTATVTLNVTPVNDPPQGSGETYTATEDTPLTVAFPGLLANDADIDSSAAQLTAAVAAQPGNGSVSVAGNGGFTFTPAANFFGTDSFTYTISDGAASSAPVTVTINVIGTPDAPLPAADQYKLFSGTPLTVNAATLSPTGTALNLIMAAPETPTGGSAQPGDTWRYLDNGSDQGTAWRQPGFNDSTWKTGRGEFGYGDSGENRPEFTLVEDNATPGYVAGDSNRYITTYFRKVFTVGDWRRLSGPAGSLLRDDGVVIWLNGQRIYFENGLDGAAYNTTTSLTIPNEATHDAIPLPAALPHLVDGENVMAVEVHQQSPGSSDMSFDLGFAVVERPYAGVLSNDTEPEGQPMTAVVETMPAHGSLVLNANGTFTYTPDAGYSGMDSFTYRASDGALTSTPGVVHLTVEPPFNQPPVAVANTYAATEDVTLNVSAALGVLANDSDPEGTPLTAALVSGITNGTLTLNANGSFSYLSNANYNGTDSFSYRASDGLKFSAPVTVTLNISAVPDVPVAVADTYLTLVGTPLVVSATVAGGSNTLTLITAAPETTGGVAQPGDLWKYLDNGSDQGIAWQSIGFDDSSWKEGRGELGYGDASENRPEVTVVEDNPEPGYTGSASDRYVTTYFRKFFAVADRNRLSNMSISLLRDDGAVVYLNGTRIHADGVLATANPLTFMTLAGNVGNESTHEGINIPTGAGLLQDGLNVLAVEVHQNARSSSDMSFDLGMTVTESIYAGVLYNDTDPEGDAFTAAIATQPANGIVGMNANGTFTYTPNAGFRGTDTFTYRAVDASGASGPATVTILVTSATNQPPVAAADTFVAAEDAEFTLSAAQGVLANDSDPDGDAMTAVLAGTVSRGTLTLNADGSFTYTPAGNYSGVDSFTYRVKDSRNLLSTPVTVTLNVAPSNDAPVTAADSYGTNPGAALTVPANQGVLANDSDVDGNTLAAQLVSSPASGTFSLQTDGGFSFTPEASGAFTFTYRASDGSVTSAETTVTINVNGQPVAGADNYTTLEDTAISRSAAAGLLSNDSDPENEPLTATVTVQPSRGILQFSANGAFTFTPQANFFGSGTFTYTVSDGIRVSAPAVVTITVTADNDPPVAQADSYGVLPGQTLTIAAAQGVISNDSDVEGSVLSVVQHTEPRFGTLTLASNGGFTYVPGAEFTQGDSFTYRVSDGELLSAPATVELFADEPGDSIVINEILYRPGTGYPENTSQEWIELHNRGTNDVNLAGWTISAGVSYTFPAGTSMAPGSHLVVAANVAAFQEANPGVLNVIGGWTGTLGNGGEKIALTDAEGTDWDEVRYASEGDWALRVRETAFGGWEWRTGAENGGRSVELRNPGISNDNGQNWAVSTALRGTPGTVNSARTANIAPIIKSMKHFPPVPGPADRVIISCELNDESAPSALTATLFWREATTASPGAFQSVPMSWDGKDGWFAKLNPLPDLTIIEWYVSASDGTNSSTWPAPTSEGQNANCNCQVSSETASALTDTCWLVLTAAEHAAFVTTTGSDSSGNKIDRQFNLTYIATRGQESEIRYRCDMRIRGNSSRDHTSTTPSAAAPPMRIRVPSDDDLDGTTKFNLNPRNSPLQHIGMRLFQAAGLRAPDVYPVEVRRNGVEYTRPTGGTGDFGMWVLMEDLSGEFIDRHWPLTNGGQVYKKGRPDEFWRSTQPAPSNPDLTLDGWIKQNGGAANDWSDLRGFFTTWQTASQPHFPGAPAGDVAGGSWDGTPFTAAELSSVETVANLDQWARWFAVMTILQSNETNISNGQDDDYGIYFEPRTVGAVTQRRMQLLPHDLDTIFGLGDSSLAFNSRGLYDSTDDGSVFASLLPLMGNNGTPGNADFRQRYHNAVRLLLGTVFDADTSANSNPPFNQMVDYQLGNWLPATTRTVIKDFMRQRRTYLLGLIGAGAIAPPAATSKATLTSAHGTLYISEVLANNVAAHNNAGTFPDVIELHNAGAAAINLASMSLTDDPLVKAKFVFPAGSAIAAGARLVMYADTAAAAPGAYTGFGLDADGDAVFLYDSTVAGQTLIDSVVFGLQPPDFTIGRTGTAADTWALCTPTVGAVNTAVPTLAVPAGIHINEWLGNADYRAATDFLELFNPAAQPVALGGMSLTDDFINFPARHVIPPLSFMAGGEFVAFEAAGNDATPGNARELPFGINATTGSVAILGANGSIADRGDTQLQFRDTSTARVPDGTGAFTAAGMPSPGASNAPLSAAVLAVLNNFRITEMMYNPSTSAQSEYIEFRNTSTTATLDLGGVFFANGISFTFPTATSLAPGAYLVIAGEPAKFSAQFPTVAVFGAYTGRLDNGGERLRMEIPERNVAILDFAYADGWHPSTDGGGDVLQIVNDSASPAMWDRSEGWQAYRPNPARGLPYDVYAGKDLTASVGVPVFLDGNVLPGPFLLSSLTLGWSKLSGPGTVTFTTADYEDANATFSAPGAYALRFSATSSGAESESVVDFVTVTVAEAYDSWTLRSLPSASNEDRLSSADPDGDGFNNFAEYALGGNPATADAGTIIQVKVIGGSLVLDYRRNLLADPGITILPEVNSELSTDWADATGSLEQASTSESGGFRSYRLTFSAAPRRFFRLQVIAP